MAQKKPTSTDDIHNAIDVYTHDHQTSMPRNMPGPMLHVAAQEPDNITQRENINNKKEIDGGGYNEERHEQYKADNGGRNGWDRCAAAKIGVGNGKGIGKGKGYGECRHCGGGGARGGNARTWRDNSNQRVRCQHSKEAKLAKSRDMGCAKVLREDATITADPRRKALEHD